jgi:voltage-gated potassium channel
MPAMTATRRKYQLFPTSPMGYTGKERAHERKRGILPKITGTYAWSVISISGILVIGTFGYRLLSGSQYSYIDCFYMTFITIATIGYGEVVDMSNNPPARIFTMVLAVAGIGVLTYTLMNATAFVVEGRINAVFWRKRMEKNILKLRKHYILCGAEAAGYYILNELHSTQRPSVVVDIQRKMIDRLVETYPDQFFIEGDPTDNDTLLRAGIEHADGVFAVTSDDNQNLVISLTSRQLNPSVRIVACGNDLKNSEKLKKAGANAVVSPGYIGGLRMASEMIRPTVVSFLDLMLRRKDETLRIEEVTIPDTFGGKTLATLNLGKFPQLLLLAIKTGEDWIYNPPRTHVMAPADVLVFMGTLEERHEFEKGLSKGQ